MFLPVNLAPMPMPKIKVESEPVALMVEIVLRNGRQIRCRGEICDGDLARLIRLVEAA